jgi:TP901 family phage tail tape measure protein
MAAEAFGGRPALAPDGTRLPAAGAVFCPFFFRGYFCVVPFQFIMANINQSANITLTLNGQQATRMLSDLEKKSQRLEAALKKAASAGDAAGAKKLQRELTNTTRLIEQMKGATLSAEDVLRRLDSATPRELNKTLKTLQSQLNGMKRGTEAWDAHAKKIQAVRAEISKMNQALNTQRSGWSRFNSWLNDTQAALMGAAAAITGLVMAGRKAVNSFAEMEESLANTRKYTGLSVEDVEKLNEAFRRMDTRTSREALNDLAQEAGRLGKNTLESVQGYVEAADIINVALVDLGAGATQTIAKLTNIFGVEKMLGTKDAMLAVGSTVNVLSQNCTASKPYLVEFAQRMAGIGSQAGLTIPQILAFGAVLDANGQKVEMSATAIQKVIMNLANKNQEFAATLGMDAERLNRTLKRSAKDGLLMFLEALQRLGRSVGFDNATMSLAPAFKDMGLDAARVSQVLSTLAMHLDEVKWQLGNATKAFNEATSATHEYEIFNNTAQASIDKARKRVVELAVELGQKLFPIMKHIYTSSGVFLRVLNQVISFVITYKKEVVSAAVAIAAYAVAVNASTVAFRLHYAAVLLVQKAQAALTAVWSSAKGAVVLFRVAVIAMTRGLGSARIAFRLLTGSMAANPFGAIAVAIAAATAALLSWINKSSKSSEMMKRLSDGIAATTAETRKEKEEIDALFLKLRSARQGSEEYQRAKDSILDKYGKYLKGLSDEVASLSNVAEAYRVITTEANNAARARGLNKANDAADEAFNSTLSEEGKKLFLGLKNARQSVRRGNSTYQEALSNTEISTWVNRLVNEVSERQFSQRSKNFLQSLGVWVDRSGTFRGGDDIADALNSTLGVVGLGADRDGAADIAEALNSMLEASRTRQEEREIVASIFGNPSSIYEGLSIMQLEALIGDLNDTMQHGRSSFFQRLPNGNNLLLERSTDIQNAISSLQIMLERAQELDEGVVVVGRRRNRRGGSGFGSAGEANTERFSEEKAWRAIEEAKAKTAYYTGQADALAHAEAMDKIAVEYFQKLSLRADLSAQERLDIEAQYWEAVNKWSRDERASSVEEEERAHAERVAALRKLYVDCDIEHEDFVRRNEFEEMVHQRNLVEIYEVGSADRLKAEQRLNELRFQWENKDRQEVRQKYEHWLKEYSNLDAANRMRLELANLDTIHEAGLISEAQYQDALNQVRQKYWNQGLPDLAKQESPQSFQALQAARDLAVRQVRELAARGDFDPDDVSASLSAIERNFQKLRLELGKNAGSPMAAQVIDLYKAWHDFFDRTAEEGENWAARIGNLAQVSFAMMATAMQSYSESVKADADLESARLENKYQRDIELAQGNNYKKLALERKLENELAAVKNRANRKLYNMQVIQAVAQTAANALSAYGAALKVGGLAGLILAPIAAAMATAAGMVQVATIKKQQQAAEAQGYRKGGFTKPGRPDEPAGVVHAGEWVASRELVNNPRTRPVIDLLERAQRSNSVGIISRDDVSSAITAPLRIAAAPAASTNSAAPVVIAAPDNTNAELADAVAALVRRLNEPFVTVNSVAGRGGIKEAQDEYNNLIKAVTPKRFKR